MSENIDDLNAVRRALSVDAQVKKAERILNELDGDHDAGPPMARPSPWAARLLFALLAAAIGSLLIMHSDGESLKMAGWWVWPTVPAGWLSVLLTLRFAIWPTPSRRVASLALPVITFLCGLAGFLQGLTPHAYTSIDGSPPGLELHWLSMVEGSRSLHLAMPALIFSAILLATGCWRLARVPTTSRIAPAGR